MPLMARVVVVKLEVLGVGLLMKEGKLSRERRKLAIERRKLARMMTVVKVWRSRVRWQVGNVVLRERVVQWWGSMRVRRIVGVDRARRASVVETLRGCKLMVSRTMAVHVTVGDLVLGPVRQDHVADLVLEAVHG